MNFIVFKIGFSNYYNGIEDNSLNIYDKFYQEKKSNNPEIYNFQDYNNFCYGYASLKDGVVNLSKLKFQNDSSTLLNNTLVIWVYEKDNKYFIVGWYKNANIYNFLQRRLSYPSVGRDLYFNVKAKSKDCFLLPLENRNFSINIPFIDNNNFYISDEKDPIYFKISQFISTYDGCFINTVINNTIDDTLKNPPENPQLLYKRGTIYLYNENNFIEALKYFNSALIFKNMLIKKELTDIYYVKAVCLQLLNSFDNCIIYFEKVLKYINYDLNIIKNMIYLYIYNENYKQAIIYCDKILNTEKINENSKIFLDEITCLKVDCLLYLEDYDLAKNILKNLLKTDLSKNLSIHCKSLLNELELL